jgi:hypothetical protein
VASTHEASAIEEDMEVANEGDEVSILEIVSDVEIVPECPVLDFLPVQSKDNLIQEEVLDVSFGQIVTILEISQSATSQEAVNTVPNLLLLTPVIPEVTSLSESIKDPQDSNTSKVILPEPLTPSNDIEPLELTNDP